MSPPTRIDIPLVRPERQSLQTDSIWCRRFWTVLIRHPGKISYLAYPDFETNPHPALLRSVKLSLRTREIDCLEYQASTNPPILHRKETFLPPDHPLYSKFASLTQQEENHGLLDDTATIGTRDGWLARLNAARLSLRGHRLVRS